MLGIESVLPEGLHLGKITAPIPGEERLRLLVM
jgi:hypothetical protein